ncbi:LCP family protein [Subtercola endophyticus]|uniref:LCP family protein n=1 Tax=Subtercola endophyticus TaxID=2895559 RepID=UPI001E2FCED9|nr:LCP family protein [Subtercola endophyticus]UFS59718.1 LCP family protein [Subtercola endophyticus]
MTSPHSPLKHSKRPSQSPIGTFLKILVAVVVVFAVSSTSVAAIAVYQTLSKIGPGIQLADPNATAAAIPSVGAIEGGVNLLLAGTDTRTDQGDAFSDAANQDASSGAGNNDVTMVLHISADHTNATVISIPRDLITAVPDCPDPNGDGGTVSGTDAAMFNTTLSRGGLACTVLTAEALTGLKIAYAAEISFDGVIAMSNAVGGVSVCLATAVTDPFTGLDLAAGQQTLVGDQALAFVRSRHGVGDGSDLGRISNQQVFLSALMRKITSAGVLANPIALFSLANAAVENMTFSTTLKDPAAMVAIALALKNVSLSNLVFVQYPVITDPDDVNRVIADDASVAVLNAALASDSPLTLTGGVGRAAVADPSTTATPAPTDTSAPADTTTPTDTATPGDTSTPTPTDTSVALPTNVSGQTAAEETCTVGNN